MELHGTIQDGQLFLSAIQEDLERQYLASFKNGTHIRKAYTREGPMKTHQQVKAIFGLIVEKIRLRLIDMRVDVFGIPLNKKMIYDALIKACGGVGDMGETLSLSEMTIDEARQFFENCRTWAAKELQLDIPDPNKNWKQERHNGK